DGIVQLRTDLNFSRLEIALSMIDEGNVARACLQHSGRRNYQLAAEGNGDVDIDVHTGFEGQTRIGEDETDLRSAGVGIDLGKNLIDSACEGASWIGVDSDLCGVTGLETSDIVLENVGIHPYCGEIGDGVEFHVRLNVGVGKGIALGDVSRCWRVDGDLALDFASLFQCCDDGGWNIELPQTFLGCLQQPAAFLRRGSMHIGRECILIFLREKILLLRADQVRAVDGEQPLTPADILIGRVDGDILNPSSEARLYVGESLLVNVHVAGYVQFVGDISQFDLRRGYANLLEPSWRNLHLGECWFGTCRYYCG